MVELEPLVLSYNAPCRADSTPLRQLRWWVLMEKRTINNLQEGVYYMRQPIPTLLYTEGEYS